jgi:uroporphyrinogen decarboxylase
MPELANDTLLRALCREPTEHTPVWLMRQAGRYLPEYNAIRAKAGSFLTLAKTPEMACEVTLQPLRRFALDAAIIFSDILTVPDAMGLGLYFAEGEGPRFARPLRDEKAILSLPVPDPEVELRYVLDALRTTRAALGGRVPLIGFAGSPYTLACYMIEGSSSNDFRAAKTLRYTRPDLMHHVLEVTARATTVYLNAQIAAGAEAVMLFDTWGGNLAFDDYPEFSLRYAQQVFAGLERQARGRVVPRILFTRHGTPWLERMPASGCDAVGLDWSSDPRVARAGIGMRTALQGNLDPASLFAGAELVRKSVRRTLDAFGPAPGHVFNLGHGIAPTTPIDSVEALVEEVHTYSRGLRQTG